MVCGAQHSKTAGKVILICLCVFLIEKTNVCLNQDLFLGSPSAFQDAYARGEVFIGSKENGHTVLPGLPPNIQGYHWQFGITIVTPDRDFLFSCETEEDQKDWMATFQTVISRPMLPQDYAGNLYNQVSQLII